MTDGQVQLYERAMGALTLIHGVARGMPAKHRQSVASDLAADACRDLYGGWPGITWGQPGLTLDEELERYAVLDLAYAQLTAMEAAVHRIRVVASQEG